MAYVVVAVLLSMNLSTLATTFGWMALRRPIIVEVDGNFDTIEYLIGPLFGDERRVVAQGVRGLCSSDPFDMDDTWTIERVGLVHKRVRLVWPQYDIEDLPVPVCP